MAGKGFGSSGLLRPSFLQAVGLGERSELLRLGRHRFYRDRELLFRERDEAHSVFVVLYGWVAMSVTSPSNGLRAILAFRRPGDLLGEAAVLDGRGFDATATALGVVEVQVIEKFAFSGFLESNADVQQLVFESVIADVRNAGTARLQSASSTVLQRLAVLLLDLVEARAEHAESDIPRIPQQYLAEAIGATRESAAKAFTVMRHLGLVRTARQRFTIVDPPGLRRLAAGEPSY